jgi:hypothetical protein
MTRDLKEEIAAELAQGNRMPGEEPYSECEKAFLRRWEKAIDDDLWTRVDSEAQSLVRGPIWAFRTARKDHEHNEADNVRREGGDHDVQDHRGRP